MIAIACVITVTIMCVAEYLSRYDRFLAHCHRLDPDKLEKLNLRMLETYHDTETRTYRYGFRDIEFVVQMERFRFLNRKVFIFVEKNKEHICRYQELSKNFKTGFYQSYLQIRYPRTFGRFVVYRSLNTNVSKRLEEFMENEKLLKI